MARRRKPNPLITTGEIVMWILFVVLLVPAGAVGWAIGHYTGQHTKTVTVGAAHTTTAAATPTTTAAKTTTAAASPSAAGKAVFDANACGSCHTFKPAASTGTIGPDLDKAPEADAKKANMSLDAFVKQSITDPNAYISPGFQKGLMPTSFGSSIKPADLAALVAFISGAK